MCAPRAPLAVLSLVAILTACSLLASPCPAQSQRERMQEMRRAKMEELRKQAAQQGFTGQPAQQGQPNGGDAKKKNKPEKDKQSDNDKANGGEAITRPDTPPRVPDPRELQVEAINGRVQFGFNGQPWPDVLQWLANVSGLSLDWQELPKGYLNLTTQRAYTLPEARDLINRHLQARGYVMLLAGEVLSVTKIDQLDPSLVPRIDEEQLYDRQPHDFVKVTFPLPTGIEVKQASEDVKQVLSKHAKVFPLAATKRLLVIDAVANLRLVSALFNEERVERSGRLVPRRFPLKHARAEQVIETLFIILGIEPKSKQTPTSPKQLQRQMQMQMQMQMGNRQQNKAKAMKPIGNDKPEVHLAFNRFDNSILANAPPEQLDIIDRTIKLLDIPPPGIESDEGAAPGARYAKTYELQSIEPDSLIRSLEEIGNLSPLTDLRGDQKSKVLFVLAGKQDHERVEKIIKQLDGPKYRVEVYPLRLHPADEVAGTLGALVAGQEEKKNDNNRRRRFIWFGYNNEEEEEEKIQLRVEADIENNRLFVRGNDEQIGEVEAFLRQIGELPSESGRNRLASDRPVRVFEAFDRQATDQLLEQLRSSWPAISGGAKLQIQDNRATEPATSNENDSSQPEGEPEPPKDRTTSVRVSSPFRFASETTDAAKPTSPEAAITVTEDGRVVISSDDPELLARLEELVGSLAPPEKTFQEFRLRHVAARYVHSKLEDFYDDILSAGFEDRVNFWGEYQGKKRKSVNSRLSRRRQLRMVYNVVTNSIVVTNASQAQLTEIERLINIWDQPPIQEAIFQRKTGLVEVRYSRATTIAAALKDVYRDLLSSRDKEFDTEESKGSGFATEQLTQIEYSGAESRDPNHKTPSRKTKAIETTFDGTLSIGVDELANVLVISADTELYESVVDMIHKLDEQAKPQTTIQVLRVDVPAGPLREALDDALERPWPGGRPEQQASGRRGNNRRQQPQNRQQPNRQRRQQQGRGR